MAHYIRRNLPQKCCGFRIIGYLVRNAKLIHELTGPYRPTCEGFGLSMEWVPADE
jgi:hypothetical protein